MLKKFEGKEVEIFELNGQVLFNPYHVGKCLELADSSVRDLLRKMNTRQVIKLKNSDVGDSNIRKLNNAGENFLTESGVYKLIFKSKKKEAEKFQDWVTDEVLPSIRKHGMYAADELLDNPDLLIQVATKLKEERELNRRLQEENEEKNKLIEKQKPKAEFYDEIIDSTTVIGMKEVADILNAKGYGRNNLFKFLRENGILNRKNEPYRKYIDQGLFEIKESKYIVDGEVKIKTTTYVTQKGLDYIRKLLNKQNKQ